jgi:hypothetical protein
LAQPPPRLDQSRKRKRAGNVIDMLEARRELMVRAIEQSQRGYEATAKSTEQARRAIEACRQGKTSMPMACDVELAAQMKPLQESTRRAEAAAGETLAKAGNAGAPEAKAGAAVPSTRAAA